MLEGSKNHSKFEVFLGHYWNFEIFPLISKRNQLFSTKKEKEKKRKRTNIFASVLACELDEDSDEGRVNG